MTTGTETVANEALTQAGIEATAALANAEKPAPDSIEAEIAEIERQQAAIDAENLKALESGTTVPGTAKPAAATTTKDAQAGAAGADNAAAAAAHADPKDRAIVALRKENQAIKLKLAETTGAARVLEHMVKTGQQPGNTEGNEDEQAAAVTPQTIAEIDAVILARAKDLEEGRLDMPTYEKERLRLMDDRFAIQTASMSGAQAQDATITDTTVQDHLTQLERDHPYLKTASHEELAAAADKANEQLRLQGAYVGLSQNRADMLMRERAAEILRAERLRQLGITEDPVKKPAVVNTAGANLSPAALARESKLNLAENHPPDISKIGTGVKGTSITSAEAYETLQSFGGDEDAALKWMAAHPEVANLR